MPIPPRLVITASQVLWHHFHHGLSGLYVSTATLRMGSAHDLRRSDNPICTYTRRCLLWACKLDAACNGVWCFIVKAFTPPHLPHNLVGYTFLCSQRLEPLLHRFVSQLRHTHHRYFIDPRHIGHTIHLWTAFVGLFSSTAIRWLSADFTELLTRLECKRASRSIREGVSRRYPIVPPFGLPVLLKRNIIDIPCFITTLCYNTYIHHTFRGCKFCTKFCLKATW